MKLASRLFAFALAIASLGASAAAVRGQALFSGQEALRGAIRGHRNGLPADVVKCNNCHATTDEKSSQPGSPPPITRSLLLEKRQRRGGPPSSYDAGSFCKLLRTGIDPAYILIANVMPIYQVDDAQCDCLWQFLTAERG